MNKIKYSIEEFRQKKMRKKTIQSVKFFCRVGWISAIVYKINPLFIETHTSQKFPYDTKDDTLGN